jgi:hypothetical protein
MSVNSSQNSSESEYEGYDEYYTNDPDGGYFLYTDTYKNTIPGYSYFYQDEKKKNSGISTYQIDCNWKNLREKQHDKYHEYVSKYKEKHEKEYWKYVRKYGCCLESNDSD